MSAFKRKAAGNETRIPVGAKCSVYNSQTLVSTGVSSLDDIVSGGGMPLNTIIMIKSDRQTGYSKLLTKYFVAQGIESKQPVLLTCFDGDYDGIINNLPTSVDIYQNVINDENDGGSVDLELMKYNELPVRTMGATRDSRRNQSRDEKMKIAWRYQSMPVVSSAFGSSLRPLRGAPFCNVFDITKPRNASEAIECGFLNLVQEKSMAHILLKIQGALDSLKFLKSNSDKSHVMRLVLSGFGSPFHHESFSEEMFRFVLKIKEITKEHNVVVFMTVPSHFVEETQQKVKRLEHLVDGVYEIESFAGTRRILNPAYINAPPGSPQYHGLFHVVKLVNCTVFPTTLRVLNSSQLKSLVFRVRRKRFSIEIFTLPPEEEDEKELSKSVKEMYIDTSKSMCSTVSNNKSSLDF